MEQNRMPGILATMAIAEKYLTTLNQNLDSKMKMQIVIQTSQICFHIFGKQSINQTFLSMHLSIS